MAILSSKLFFTQWIKRCGILPKDSRQWFRAWRSNESNRCIGEVSGPIVSVSAPSETSFKVCSDVLELYLYHYYYSEVLKNQNNEYETQLIQLFDSFKNMQTLSTSSNLLYDSVDPMQHFHSFVKFFQENIMVLWKYSLLKKRVLFYSKPPLETACHSGESIDW